MARATPPSGQANGTPSDDHSAEPTTWDVELLRVLVTRNGTQVDAQWAIHPQLKHDLRSEEWTEVTDLMAKVADIVGHRFSEVLSSVEPDPPGHA
jgi:hypothetical protein